MLSTPSCIEPHNRIIELIASKYGNVRSEVEASAIQKWDSRLLLRKRKKYCSHSMNGKTLFFFKERQVNGKLWFEDLPLNFVSSFFFIGSCTSSVFKELWYEASINRGRLILEPNETISTESKGTVKRATKTCNPFCNSVAKRVE